MIEKVIDKSTSNRPTMIRSWMTQGEPKAKDQQFQAENMHSYECQMSYSQIFVCFDWTCSCQQHKQIRQVIRVDSDYDQVCCGLRLSSICNMNKSCQHTLLSTRNTAWNTASHYPIVHIGRQIVPNRLGWRMMIVMMAILGHPIIHHRIWMMVVAIW